MMLMPLRHEYPELAADMPSTEEALRAARSTGLGMYEAMLLAMRVGDAVAVGDLRPRVAVGGRIAGRSRARARRRNDRRVQPHAMISVAAACGDYDAAAYFHGAVRDQIPALSRVAVAAASRSGARRCSS